MDCFPPDDIRNVRVQSVLTEPRSAYQNWQMVLSWEAPAQESSPLKAYHIYRRSGNSGSFIHLAETEPGHTVYIDNTVYALSNPSNPLVIYRVVAEDAVGHMREVNSCSWEASDRVLNAPVIRFDVRPDLETVIRDTLYTNSDSVSLALENFDWSGAGEFYVSVNQHNHQLLNPGTGFLAVALDPVQLTSEIKVRAIYKGGRSGIWSVPIIAVRDSVPPSFLEAWNSPDSSLGYIYLHWNRTSLAADRYDIYRSDSGGNPFKLIGSVPANHNMLKYTDRENLQAYQYFTYKVRPYTKTKRNGPFSNTDTDYCNRPPGVIDHTVIDRGNGLFDISIVWKRGWPIGVPNRFITDVHIYRDYLDQALSMGTVSTEPMDTAFVLFDVAIRHNYLFQLREKLDNDPQHRSSGLSLPYTVSLKALEMEALTQPHRKIFLTWDSKIVDTLDVSAFHLFRSVNDQVELDTLLSPTQFTFLDEDERLIHNQMYFYHLIAVNKYQHVLASNDTTVLCDSGLVYIPTIDPLPDYFNGRTLPICWHWGLDGGIDTTTTRGAAKLLLQISTKSGFPVTPEGQTVEYQFDADAHNRCGQFAIPDLASKVNSQLWVRMVAMDAWDNPHPRIESDIETTRFDEIFPIPVDSFQVSSVHGLDTATDSIVVLLTWNDMSLLDGNDLVRNVVHYRIMRQWGGQQNIVGRWPVSAGVPVYTFLDTVPNRPYSWRLVSVDAANNETANGWITAPFFIATPDTECIQPLEFRSCHIQGLENEVHDYFVEIAMFENHFKIAYQMGSEQLDFLLCRSGWQTAQSDTFRCTTGWGGHFRLDTVYFRIKARQGTAWESGWSDLRIFTSGMNKPGAANGITAEGELPEAFRVFFNYPNPFNAVTTITYGLPEAGHSRVCIYNIAGAMVKLLVDCDQPAGYHDCQWKGDNEAGETVASGIYIYEIESQSKTGGHYQSRMKMMLLK
jgi:hypothetical protein